MADLDIEWLTSSIGKQVTTEVSLFSDPLIAASKLRAKYPEIDSEKIRQSIAQANLQMGPVKADDTEGRVTVLPLILLEAHLPILLGVRHIQQPLSPVRISRPGTVEAQHPRTEITLGTGGATPTHHLVGGTAAAE